mgnify:CR=1 FL=1
MPDKILFFRPDHIGDLLLTTPAICLMKKSFPENELVLMINPSAKDILKNNPYVDRIELCDFVFIKGFNRKVIFNTLSNLVKVRKGKFDAVFNFRVSAVAGAFVYFSGGREIFGFDIKKSKWAHSRVIHYNSERHVVDNYLSLVEAYGCKGENNEGLQIFLTEEEKSGFKRKVNLDRKYIILCPGAGELSKLWLNDRWSEIADWILNNTDYEIVFTGVSREKDMVEEIMKMMKIGTDKVHNFAGFLSLREFAILVNGAEFIVAVDSGSVHISVAMKTPVVGLYGPHNPIEWGPYNNGLPNKVIVKKNYDCQFCKKYDCKKKYCMKDIYVEDVIEKIEELLNDLKKLNG